MGKSLKRSFNLLVAMSVCLMSFNGFAQNDEDIMQESVNDLFVVGAFSLGGAVLGLSTLSFADKPSDKTDNILMGGALGLILGVGVVAYMQANKSKDMYYEAKIDSKSFSTSDRFAWHKTSHEKYSDSKMPSFTYAFKF